MEKITKIGYKPDVSWVVKDIPVEDKEMDLCEHSERFALYFAMMEDTSDKPVIIFKNLRVCGDCHTHTALVSKAFQREIRLRDSAVWHIFENGQCSCKNKF
uniref:DYW domain-containing protein n=1 Tax=Arcella intermedia TaxID=1963864 RepID=A0A6B2LSN7_9EUKA